MKPLIYLTLLLGTISCDDQPKNESRVESLPYFNEASFTPHWLDSQSDSLSNFHKIPSFSLINQDGTHITEADLDGKVYVANFFFTVCPGICPQMTDNMKILQDEFENVSGVMLMSHSVTPSRDSVSVLKAYAEKREIKSSNWHLLTGARSDIYDLGRKAYFVEEDMGLLKSEEDFLHTENLVLVDKNRHIRGVYNGLSKTSISQLKADINLLLQEG